MKTHKWEWWRHCSQVIVVVTAFAATTGSVGYSEDKENTDVGEKLLSEYIADAMIMSGRYACYFKGRRNTVGIEKGGGRFTEREFVYIRGESTKVKREYESYVACDVKNVPPGHFRWQEILVRDGNAWFSGGIRTPHPPRHILSRLSPSIKDLSDDAHLRKKWAPMSFSPLALAVGTYGDFLAGGEQASTMTRALHYDCVKSHSPEPGGHRTFEYVTNGGKNLFKCTFSEAHGNRPVRAVWSRLGENGEPHAPFSIVDTSWKEANEVWVPTRFEALGQEPHGTTRQLLMLGEWFAQESIDDSFFPDLTDGLWYDAPVRYLQSKSTLLEEGIFQPFDDFRAQLPERKVP